MTAPITGIWDTLTQPQLRAAGMIAINQDLGHPPAVTAVLERLGVVQSFTEMLSGNPPIHVTRFRMPLHMHRSWCAWCARKDRKDEP